MQSLASILQDYFIDYEKRPWFRGKLPKNPTSPLEGRGKITPRADVILLLLAFILPLATSPLASAAPTLVPITKNVGTPHNTSVWTEKPATTFTTLGDWKRTVTTNNWDWISLANQDLETRFSAAPIDEKNGSIVFLDVTSGECEQPVTPLPWTQDILSKCIVPARLNPDGSASYYQDSGDVPNQGYRYQALYQPTGKIKLTSRTKTENFSGQYVSNMTANVVECTDTCYHFIINPPYSFQDYLSTPTHKKSRVASVTGTKWFVSNGQGFSLTGGYEWVRKWQQQYDPNYTYLKGYNAQYTSIEIGRNLQVDPSYTAPTDFDTELINGTSEACPQFDFACKLGNLWDGVADTMLAVGKTITDFMSTVFVPDIDQLSKEFDTLGGEVAHKLGFIYWAFDSIRDLGVAVSGNGTGGTCTASDCTRNFGTFFGSAVTVDFAALSRINSTAFTYLRWMLTGLATLTLIFAFHRKYEEFMEGR